MFIAEREAPQQHMSQCVFHPSGLVFEGPSPGGGRRSAEGVKIRVEPHSPRGFRTGMPRQVF